ncbi:hypothetical protein AOC05_06845 [Arthrobacter alpinus]|uniref:ABC transporter domain-containing protein n=1 Tax=Arthrobacter alpinus TaxID=656366 RepID=A0A0M4QY08_9MICC|nr:ABC transporter ATP-binding protein/permease [Arthrobacter alpinus]ALE92114.1 hypothetical protein AOC05_06845 [Arthrobacter alpinus]
MSVPEEETESADPRAIVELFHIQRSFEQSGGPIALKEVNLTVYPGDFLAIIGASGSGKSTLLNIIGLLDTPTSGHLYLNGIDVSSATEKSRNRLRSAFLGFVFQASHVIGRDSVARNAALSLRIQGVARKERPEIVGYWLDYFGLGHRASSLGKQISGGEKQRLALARAVASGPLLLLADEPTGNLDATNSELVIDHLKQLNAAGTTIIVITHDPTVAAAAKRQVGMIDGSLHDGNPHIAEAEQLRTRREGSNRFGKRRPVRELSDLISDALTGISTSFGRSILLIVAFMLGIAGLVASTGISQSAATQISEKISQSALDEVRFSKTVPADSPDLEPVLQWVEGVQSSLSRIDGVVGAGFKSVLPEKAMTISRFSPLSLSPLPISNTSVVMVDQTFLSTNDLSISPTTPSIFATDTPTKAAILGRQAAEKLGIEPKSTGNSIWVSGQEIPVVGILTDSPRDPALESAILLSPGVAKASYANTTIVVRTQPGYPAPLSNVLASAIEPGNPASIKINTVGDLRTLARGVRSDLSILIGGVSVILLLLAMLSAATTMYVSVRSRTSEIALRRALGSSQASIASLFLLEGGFMGAIGGLLGCAAGSSAIVIICIAQGWSAVLAWWWLPAAASIGLATGIISALVPALIAAKQNPAQAIRD